MKPNHIEPYILYGQKGSGSVAVEATLALIGAPHRVIEVGGEALPGTDSLTDADLARINPAAQVPALRLPSGELMTESAAILIFLAEAHPEARLAPLPGDRRRPSFLRWMTFVSAQIYALIWATDDPTRLAATPEHQALLVERVHEKIARSWRIMASQVQPGEYLLGDQLTVLDLYVTVASAWGPRRARFAQAAPAMATVVARVERDPRIAELWRRRFSAP